MNQFVVSARKYRPATFDTVVGQAHITNTLKNAIKQNHLAQAFLFCGPRGVGKTTCARILAKTINCQFISESTEACNNCDSCVSFNNGQSLNIFELDAASNNSVEDIRNLVDQVRFAPHSGQYKIYIIDEVHMLSANAFNAFLKTLEEPPSYAIFILATTEKHKIIPTILSRCQIFDFNRIKIEDIASHLAYVAKSEEVVAEPDALHVIAQKADGALRDALSIFDQIVSFAGHTVTYKDAINNLSILDYDYYFKITDQINCGDTSGALLTYNELTNDGFDGHQFINGLGSHFRDLLVCKDESTMILLEVSDSIKTKYSQQSKAISTSTLFHFLETTSKCDIEYKSARNQRLLVELTLLKMCVLAGNSGIDTSTASIPEKKSLDVKTTLKESSVNVKNINSEKQNVIATENTVQKNTLAEEPDEELRSKSIQPNTRVLEVENTTKVTSPTVAPVEQSTPRPSHTAGRVGGSLLKTASLASLNQRKEEKAEIAKPNLDNVPADVFSQADLEIVWTEFASKVLSEGKKQLNTTLTMNRPMIIEDFQIKLIINNQSQDNIIQEEKQELLDFIRRQLNNYKINLVTEIQDLSGSDEVAYTNKERYMKMIEKNPEVEELRKQLGLDLL
jgi:DNA polymerase III subunit gamma/tau